MKRDLEMYKWDLNAYLFLPYCIHFKAETIPAVSELLFILHLPILNYSKTSARIPLFTTSVSGNFQQKWATGCMWLISDKEHFDYGAALFFFFKHLWACSHEHDDLSPDHQYPCKINHSIHCGIHLKPPAGGQRHTDNKLTCLSTWSLVWDSHWRCDLLASCSKHLPPCFPWYLWSGRLEL